MALAKCQMVSSVFTRTLGPLAAWTNVSGNQYGSPRVSGSDPLVGFGTNLLLVGIDTRSSSGTADIVGRVLDTNFNFITNSTVALGSSNHAAGSPDVAFFGGTNTWVVVYDYDSGGFGTNYDIKATEVNVSGSLGTTINVSIGSASQTTPAVTGYGSGGNQAFVTWKEGTTNSGPFQIMGIRVTSPMNIALPQVAIGGDVVLANINDS